jgi:hypothetical protein
VAEDEAVRHQRLTFTLIERLVRPNRDFDTKTEVVDAFEDVLVSPEGIVPDGASRRLATRA